MARVVRKYSPTAELANERFLEAVLDDEGYPDGASFVGADEPHFGTALADAVANQQPLVVVYDDGSQLIGMPNDAGLVFSRMPAALPDERGASRSVAHPVWIRLIGIMNKRPLEPRQAAEELGIPLSVAFAHFRVLDQAGMISRVETRQERGMTVHVYRLSDPLPMPNEEQDELA
jgi:hypothetical protein